MRFQDGRLDGVDSLHPSFGITRIDQPERFTQGYIVRIGRGPSRLTHYISDRGAGSKRNALLEAIKTRDEFLEAYCGPPLRRVRHRSTLNPDELPA